MAGDDLPSVVEFSEDIADAPEPKPLPLGEYTAQIRGAAVKLSQRSTKYAAVDFFISPDQYPVDFTDGNPDGLVITYRRVPMEDNPQARYNLRRFCEAIGSPMAKQIDVNMWVGATAKVKIAHEKYEGITRAVIEAVRAA